MDLDNGRIVNSRSFLDPTRVVLKSVDVYVIVDYYSAKISFLSKLDLNDGRSRGTI